MLLAKFYPNDHVEDDDSPTALEYLPERMGITLYHEVGHVLGEDHIEDYGMLMYAGAQPESAYRNLGIVLIDDSQCISLAREQLQEPDLFTVDLSEEPCGHPDSESTGTFVELESDFEEPGPLDGGVGGSSESGGCACRISSHHRQSSTNFHVILAVLVLLLRPHRRPTRLFSRKIVVVATLVLSTFACNAIPTLDGVAANYLETDGGSGRAVLCRDVDRDGWCSGQGGDCNDRRASVHPGAEEKCDGVDNNCDERVDEGFGVGLGCSITLDTCTATGTTTCADANTSVCFPSERFRESCNGLDDDCDGTVDEGQQGSGSECDTGSEGTCAAGSFLCAAGELACEFLVASSDETCDGADNDCDGIVDEGELGAPITRTCYTGAEATEDVGTCHGGERSCLDSHLGPCIGQVLPGVELCDGQDNDCDGLSDVDDDDIVGGCGCTPMSTRACYTGPSGTDAVGVCHSGIQGCIEDGTFGTWSECLSEVVPVEETCTPPGDAAADEDCDGEVDETLMAGDDPVELGDACERGVGGCRAQGVYQCDAGAAVVCSAAPSMPLPEVCDGIDNNCNGQVDESPVDAACSVGLGACVRNGVQVCDPESQELECNAVAGVPAAESCNEVDDDCDGVVDNHLQVGGQAVVLGEECTVGVGVCARIGVWECGAGGATQCSVQPGGPGSELCDGLDNDCDGTVDNGFGLGNPCSGIGVCAVGVVQCNPANLQPVCSTLPGGSGYTPAEHIEQCDSLDNDCDGAADESFFALGNECTAYCGGGLSRPGTYECSADFAATICSTSFGGSESEAELCDGIDNDCDWFVDDGFDVGTACTVGVGGCQASSTKVCNPAHDGTTCPATPGTPGTELECDGVDNDCDGNVDEGYPVGAEIAAVGVTCSDGLDNDCDTLIDSLDTPDCP